MFYFPERCQRNYLFVGRILRSGWSLRLLKRMRGMSRRMGLVVRHAADSDWPAEWQVDPHADLQSDAAEIANEFRKMHAISA